MKISDLSQELHESEFKCYVCDEIVSSQDSSKYIARACGHSSCQECIPMSYIHAFPSPIQVHEDKPTTFKMSNCTVNIPISYIHASPSPTQVHENEPTTFRMSNCVLNVPGLCGICYFQKMARAAIDKGSYQFKDLFCGK